MSKAIKASAQVATVAKVDYKELVRMGQDVIASTSDTEGKWVAFGPYVASFYGTRKALENAKAQVIADIIRPKLLYKGESADGILKRDTGPDSRSAEGKALRDSGSPLHAQYAALKKLQHNVAARMDTIFGLLRDKYAFPLTEAERAAKRAKSTKKAAQEVTAQGGGDIKRLKGKLAIQHAKIMAGMLAQLQKAEGATFNVTKALEAGKTYLAIVTTEITKAAK